MTKQTNKYFIYGIIISYTTFLDTNTHETLEEILSEESDIQGIFTGRNGDFLIIGKVLETDETKDNEPLIVPELAEIDILMTKFLIKKRYGFEGEFHYYFVKK